MRRILNFSELQEISKPDVPVLIDFYADWCGPCKAMAPFFLQLSEKHKTIEFVKANVDETEELAEFFGVTALPTFVLLKNGKEIKRFSGSSRQKVEELVQFGLQ